MLGFGTFHVSNDMGGKTTALGATGGTRGKDPMAAENHCPGAT